MITQAQRYTTTTITWLFLLVLVTVGQGSMCDGLQQPPLDSDGDGVLDDGDQSGIAGDSPCADGVTSGCDDNCPEEANANQADGDGDGAGDPCDLDPNDPDVTGTSGAGGAGGGGDGGSVDGSGDGSGGGTGTVTTTVYLNQDANLGWTSAEPCMTQEAGAGTAAGSLSINGDLLIEQELFLPRGSAGSAYVECRAASEFVVQADPGDPVPDDPNEPPRSEVGWITFDASHLAQALDASNYAITFLIDVLGPDPAVPVEQFGFAYGDTVSPPLAFPATMNYSRQVAVVLREGQTYSIEVLVRSGFGSAGADFGQNDGGEIDFGFAIADLRVEFGFPN